VPWRPLDVQLFDRIGRRAQLTSEGEDLLQRARRVLTDVESLGERARALKSGQTGVLRLGASPQVMETLLAGFLPRYRRRHPGVEVHLVELGVRPRPSISSGAMFTCRSSRGVTRDYVRGRCFQCTS
jgi:DNA-binding transcriptional LysR family regulator